MKPSPAALAFLLLAASSSEAFAKKGEERWLATSNTALSITGDILLSPTRLRAVGVDFPLKVVADVPNFQNDLHNHVPARILFVTRPMDPKLLHGNKLGCGDGQPVRWIVVWQFERGKSLGMHTFTGTRMPMSASDQSFCGSYYYYRK